MVVLIAMRTLTTQAGSTHVVIIGKKAGRVLVVRTAR